MEVRRISYELSRAYLAECDTRTVVRVNVGCNLEDEACELLFLWANHALFCLCRLW